jgi:hypothetical protein
VVGPLQYREGRERSFVAEKFGAADRELFSTPNICGIPAG